MDFVNLQGFNMLNPFIESFDVALARTEGAGVNEVTPAVFPDQGVAAGLETPARLSREPGGGAPEGTFRCPPERPEVDFDFELVTAIVLRLSPLLRLPAGEYPSGLPPRRPPEF